MPEQWIAGVYLAALSAVALVLAVLYAPVLGVVALLLALVGRAVVGSRQSAAAS